MYVILYTLYYITSNVCYTYIRLYVYVLMRMCNMSLIHGYAQTHRFTACIAYTCLRRSVSRPPLCSTRQPHNDNDNNDDNDKHIINVIIITITIITSMLVKS